MADITLSVERARAEEIATPLLIVPLPEESPPDAVAAIDAALGNALSAAMERGDFRGRRDDVLMVYPGTAGRSERAVLVGVGKLNEWGAEPLRRAVGSGVRYAERIRVTGAAVWIDPLLALGGGFTTESLALIVAETAGLATWDYRDLKTADRDAPAPVESVTLIVSEAGSEASVRNGASRGEVTARAVNLARGLAVRPGNIATPTFLADAAAAIAGRFAMRLTVLDRAAMQREGMKALLAVAQGSDEEPRFIALEHTSAGSGRAPLILIGKGVTFDSGGISIKPADRMEEMKYDMSGAAAVLGAMQAIGELGVAANVVGLIPSTENLPSGRAVKPGDVVGSHQGKTIEVVNTDAEGRLILADALSYAQRYQPAAVLDAATLTGAVVVALGHHAIGLMGNDDALIEEVRAIGDRVGERCWPLPLWREYRDQLDSSVADIKNSGGRPAGAITGGWFLREFAGASPWAHLDIAGTAYRDEAVPYLRKGATGAPTRIFIEWVRSRMEG
jgi:leucyl aminopeptidase